MEKKKTMLLDWMRKVHQLEYAHCYQSDYYRKIEKRIGISAFVLSTMVAFSYKFPEIKNEWFNTYLFFLDKDYFLPFLLFIVALFTGLQTFLKPNEKSDIHRKLGLEYEKIRHTIEITLTKEESELNIDREILKIKKSWDSMNTIYVMERYFVKAKDKVKTFEKYPKELSFLEDVK